jgi:hypothetical protein
MQFDTCISREESALHMEKPISVVLEFYPKNLNEQPLNVGPKQNNEELLNVI